MVKKQIVVDEYEEKDLRTHIYETTDTYAGSDQIIDAQLSVMKEGEKDIQITETKYIPVIYKMFDEIIVNARDQRERLKDRSGAINLTEIKVDVNKETGCVSVYNNGDSIRVEKHSSGVYNPHLIFGRLLTSGNYKKGEKRTVGGKNGYGAKIVNIFSTEFNVELVDRFTKQKYIQTFTDNMQKFTEPKITKSTAKPYTKITWKTDFKRFGIDGFTDDMISLMKRRVYDIAGATDNKVSVYYNSKKLNIKSFQDYIELYPTVKAKTYEKLSERWELGISVSSNDKFEQISFVNGISTPNGGIHVDVVTKIISSLVVKYIKKKHKKDVQEKYVKNYLSVYLNCVIENPSFDSQAKERLITPKSKFGSQPEINEKMIKKACDSGLSEKVMQFSDFKENSLTKKTDGKKTSKLRDIPKLDDANWAGTRRSDQCTLILTEGDSAKSMAIAGLSIVGRDKYGVFPLKGKVLNVRDANPKQITGNAEITNIKKILGLESGKKYKETKSLRYGKVMIMTDQDHDGSHIKGLVLNMFHSLWPELLKLEYINCMVTPIIKATQGKKIKSFYTLTDYGKWKEKKDNNKWKVKYYKGLGTSTSNEAKEYFKELKINQYITEGKTDETMILAFKKTEADQRKSWLKSYKEEEILDYNCKETKIDDFINLEFKHFSNSDNMRSIGSCIDGLKVSQRKILFSCFKRKLHQEIRVAQLSGYVSEQAAYHHGEASLQGAIVGMAQDFVGTNNINLLLPNGQFGTRIMGGNDSASARYIHTQLNPIVDKIFPSSDFPLLDYINDDGLMVEPKWYCPIIPMVLVNGMVGIGTGFSTTIPQFNPLDCCKNIRRKMDGLPYLSMKPYYRGFTGKIEKFVEKGIQKFITKGKYRIEDDSVIISELPIGKWTHDFKEFLEKTIQEEDSWILDYENHSTDQRVNFVIKINDETLFDNTYKNKDVIEEKFKLTSPKTTSNIHLYTKDGAIKKYDDIYKIQDEHYYTRLTMYQNRKEYELNVLVKSIKLLEAKMRFIEYVIDEKIVVYKKSKTTIIESLKNYEFPFYENNCIIDYCILNNTSKVITSEYNYLLNMPIHSFTLEKVNELQTDIEEKKNQHDTLECRDIKDIWRDELDEFELHYKKM
jgi:DNA topoisomerase II